MIKTEIKKLQLSSLKEFPDNPQEVSQEKMALIKKNMREKGWYGEIPLIWDNYIVSGNHRVMCAIDVGIIEQDCIVIIDENYGWEQAKKDCIMFNTLHGEPDQDKLKDFIGNILDDFELDIEGLSDSIGLGEEEINEILQISDYDINDFEENKKENLIENICPKCGFKWQK